MDKVAEDVLPFNLTKVAPLRTLADENCIEDTVFMHSVRNASLALKLRTVSQVILESLEYDIPVYSN